MSVLVRSLYAALLLGLLGADVEVRAQDQPWIAVIVPGDEARRFSARDLSLVFQRKKLYANDGLRWVPVNLPADHPMRDRFSLAVLGLHPEALDEYWKQQYFQGVLPPHVVGSERAMLRFVATTVHAIGYVGACYSEPGLRTIVLIDPSGDLRPPEQQPACPITPDPAVPSTP